MVKVNVQPNCDNTPKKILLRDFTIAIATNDLPIIFNCVIDEVEWELEMVGKYAIVNAFNELFDTSIEEMTITDICISGDVEIGLTKGIISTISGKTHYFTIMCWFASNHERAKIKRLTSWQSDGPNNWGQFPSHPHF